MVEYMSISSDVVCESFCMIESVYTLAGKNELVTVKLFTEFVNVETIKK